MTCAVVEYQNGKKTHHTNVMSCSLVMRRCQSSVKLILGDGSEQMIVGAVSGRLVDDAWYVQNASRLMPQ